MEAPAGTHGIALVDTHASAANPSVAAALALEGIFKSYAAPVLTDINLQIRKGEVHALVGANGAGKSTLARIICGLTIADSGSIQLAGRGYSPRTKADAEHAGVHIVQQELNLLPTLTVAENLFLNRLPSTGGFVSRGRLRDKAREALDAIGLYNVSPDALVAELGIGQQQMIEIASALSRNLRVLILDEPTAALTAPEVEILFSRVRSLKSAGVALIYISHRMEEICAIADNVSVLRDGQIVDTRPVAQATVDSMVSLMVGSNSNEHAGEKLTHTKAPAAVNAAPVIFRVQNVFGGALTQDVSFEVHAGEILGVAGLVGSGRTETLRCIYGADAKTAGKISIGNPLREVQITSPEDAVRAGIGFVPEDRKGQGLLLTESIRSNISLAKLAAMSGVGGWINGRNESATADRFANDLSIACAGIEQRVERLSGGNQQKVLLGRWLLRDSQVLLLDEPTRGIDISSRQAIYSLLHDLAAGGKALVVVSSDLLELMEISDRIAVMSAGRLVATFPREEWTEEKIMSAAFSGYGGKRGQ